jgi:phosphate:Na+ symporter
VFLLKLGVEPLLGNPVVRDASVEIAAEPFTMFFSALAGTAILQSSASVRALAVTVASSGAIPQSAVFPVTLGAHLGGAVTVLLAASGGRRNARVLGIATLLYKLAGVVAFAPLVPMTDTFLDGLVVSTPARIVLAQAILAIFNAALFYPWPDALIHGGAFILSRQRAADLGAPAYLDDGLLEIPPIAVKLLSKEMIRLTNYIEAFLQIRLYPDRRSGELGELLPPAITELTEACEGYTYAIRPPTDTKDRLALLEYKTVTYAMPSLREVSRITTGPFRDLAEERAAKPADSGVGEAERNALSALFMRTMRDAFHAFSLGDGELAQRAVDGGAAFEKSTAMLRSRLLREGSGGDSSFLYFVTVKERLARAALDIIRGDAAL